MVSTLLAAASSTFWSMSQSATSSTLGWPVISLMWSLPRPRRPMVATRMVSFGLPKTVVEAAAAGGMAGVVVGTRMVSFGLPKTVVEAAAAAAVVRKKFRRSIGFVIAIRRLLYHNSGDFRSASPKSTQAPGNASRILPVLVNSYSGQRAVDSHGGGEVAAGIEYGHAPNAGRRGAGAVESRSVRLEERFETRPVAEEIAHTGRLGVAWWEVAPRNRRILRERTHALDIHADLYIERHRHQRHFARMREVEADFRRREKVRLALLVERKVEFCGGDACEDGAQRGVGAQVAAAQRRRGKPRGALRFPGGGL